MGGEEEVGWAAAGGGEVQWERGGGGRGRHEKAGDRERGRGAGLFRRGLAFDHSQLLNLQMTKFKFKPFC